MQILFIVAVLSFLALVWAAVAITRHVRRSPSLASEASLPTKLPQPTEPRPGRKSPSPINTARRATRRA